MRKHFIILLLLPMLFLTSCKEKELKLERHFDGNNVGIYIDAKQKFPLEPWQVNLSVKSYQLRESKLQFEFHNSSLSNDNIKITESGIHTYDVVFENGEGTKATFQITADQEQLQISREGF